MCCHHQNTSVAAKSTVSRVDKMSHQGTFLIYILGHWHRQTHQQLFLMSFIFLREEEKISLPQHQVEQDLFTK